MKRKPKVDTNHPHIVQALRTAGASVQSLAGQGGGCPDLLVGYMGRNYLIEIKDGDRPPSKRKLTPLEKQWHDNWHGDVFVVYSANEAISLLTD